MKSIVAACLLAFASANRFKCGISQYETYLKSFAQGFQIDLSSTNTDCYKTTDAFSHMISDVVTAVKTVDGEDWLAPVYTFQETLVELTTVFSDCQTTNAAKQLMTRTTQFGGLFELFGTAAAARVRQDQSPGESELYNAYTQWSTSADCAVQAKNTGLILARMLNYEAPEQVFYEEVGFSLLDQLSNAQ